MFYSNKFKKLIEDEKKIEDLLLGSGFRVGKVGEKFREWKERREFIVQAINKNGSILDVGCANGFLLKCLQEWSNHKLIPYGIDWNLKLIEQAKNLFPLKANNFIVKDARDLSDLFEYGFPAKFDFIYWSVWDQDSSIDQGRLKILKTLLKAACGGRLIMGSYESDKDKNRIIKDLKKMGIEPSAILENRNGKERIIILDVK